MYACDLNELRTMWTHAHKVTYEVSLICSASPTSLSTQDCIVLALPAYNNFILGKSAPANVDDAAAAILHILVSL